MCTFYIFTKVLCYTNTPQYLPCFNIAFSSHLQPYHSVFQLQFQHFPDTYHHLYLPVYTTTLSSLSQLPHSLFQFPIPASSIFPAFYNSLINFPKHYQYRIINKNIVITFPRSLAALRLTRKRIELADLYKILPSLTLDAVPRQSVPRDF